MADKGYKTEGYVTIRNMAHSPLFPGQGSLLHHLDIELTERCNNNCIHCNINLPADDEQAQSRELSTAQWKEILRQAADLGALLVRFTGGEPLLREDFVELYLFARRLGMKVLLFTNGRLITPELAELLVKYPPLKEIEITVYGMHPESYDAVTREPGAFEEFRRGIDLLLEYRVPFAVKSVLLPPNRAERDEFEVWAAGLPWADDNHLYAVFLDLRGRRDSEAANRRIASLRFSPEEGVELFRLRHDVYRKEMAEFALKFMGPQGDRLFACGAGDCGCVDAYGGYQVCLLLRDPGTVCNLLDDKGHVREGGLREALTDAFPRVRKLRATSLEYLARCARCFLKGLCEQCPARSWTEHGTLDAPVEYFCEVAHAQARYLGLLREREHAWEVEDWRQRIEELRTAMSARAGAERLEDGG